MPKRQFLLGIWMLATVLLPFAALILGALLDPHLAENTDSRILLWSFSGITADFIIASWGAS